LEVGSWELELVVDGPFLSSLLPMPTQIVWYKSLYWRIAFGFVATLAALLLAQGVVLLWLTDRIVGGSSRTPEQLVTMAASDLSAALTQNPDLALDNYVRNEFRHIYRPFVVVMRDGRAASNRPNGLPRGYMRGMQQRIQRGASLPEIQSRESGRGRPDVGPPGGSASAPIIVSDAEVGFVVVPIAPPPVFVAIRELGPTLTWVGLALLALGAASAALLIFSPAHRRLRTLEQAARALGEGRTDVRAVEGGGDEVSSLGHAFNRMADDLNARAAALAASDRARRQLLADVSHELMTPLAAVRGYTETLSMPELTLDDETQRRYVGIISDETMKLEALIGDLLDLARLEGGGGALRIEEVPVKELFRRIADRHGPAIRDGRISLEMNVTPPDLTVRADGQKLEQALQNLAANALRHTPADGRLILDADASREGTRISVRDTGPGISPEHLPHVFERFYKTDASRTATSLSGSGLGLSIVQAIVERHGGTVTAANAPDSGAVFEIRIPRTGPEYPPDSAPPS
jgi:two-component system OmpR family sensor kinase